MPLNVAVAAAVIPSVAVFLAKRKLFWGIFSTVFPALTVPAFDGQSVICQVSIWLV